MPTARRRRSCSIPATNLRIGTRYLRDLLDLFSNSVPLALAAYNAGEGSVIDHANTIPPFAETRDYVRRVQHGLRAVSSAAERVAGTGQAGELQRKPANGEPR